MMKAKVVMKKAAKLDVLNKVMVNVTKAEEQAAKALALEKKIEEKAALKVLNAQVKKEEILKRKIEKEALKKAETLEKKKIKAETILAQKKEKKNKNEYIPVIEDIVYFDTKQVNSRKKNTYTNVIRENVIHKILQIPETYFEDPTYGSQWKNLKSQFDHFVSQLYSEPFSYLKIEKMAGRKYNYDFKFLFHNDANVIIHESNIEFKYNCSSLHKLPQFIQLNMNHEVNDISYAEYFYDNYLDEYLAVDDKLSTLVKLDKVEYMLCITSTDHDTNPFFRTLKDNHVSGTASYENKCAISKRSIKAFLETHGESVINSVKLTEKFNESQGGKTFMMWDGNKFHLDKFDEESLNIKKYEGIVNNNSLIFSSDKLKYKLLLAWKNDQGILNPAWYISIV